MKRFEEEGIITSRARSGRPPLLGQAQRREMVEVYKSNGYHLQSLMDLTDLRFLVIYVFFSIVTPPVEYFQRFFDVDVYFQIVHQTNLYANQKQTKNRLT